MLLCVRLHMRALCDWLGACMGWEFLVWLSVESLHHSLTFSSVLELRKTARSRRMRWSCPHLCQLSWQLLFRLLHLWSPRSFQEIFGCLQAVPLQWVLLLKWVSIARLDCNHTFGIVLPSTLKAHSEVQSRSLWTSKASIRPHKAKGSFANSHSIPSLFYRQAL